MRKLFLAFVFLCVLCGSAFSQNLATVSGANIQDLNGAKLANGQICFLGTDQSDNPISFQIGGGGQALRRQYCAQIAAGVIASFTVPNPAATLPSGIYYRVTVKDTSTGQEVLRYTGVTFAGGTFNFDNYTPVLSGASFAPLSGTSVSGNLGVTGNVAATGTVTGSNIPGTIPGTGSCTNQFVTALNNALAPTCTTDTLASAQHANQGTTTTVLHGNAAGNPSWSAVVLSSDVSGTLPLANGGTGQATAAAAFNALSPMTTLGDVTYESAANTASRLAGNTTTTKQYLSQTGTGTVSGAPSWQQIAAADLSDGNTGTGNIVHSTAPSISSPTTTGTDSGTETLQNKTLAGTTQFNRLAATQGTALTSADFTFSAGWGTGATIGGIHGTDSAFVFTMTAGTSPTANPTVTLTFHDGTWTHAPICVISPLNTGSVLINWAATSSSTTSVVMSARASAESSVPLNAVPYGATVHCAGSPN